MIGCLHVVSRYVSPYVSHKPGHVTSCFTHLWARCPFVRHFHPYRKFQLAYCYYPWSEHPVATVYIMASQDLISQFSQDSNAIPATQPDRSRTPRRPHHAWHQTVPTFRGPMHYAMTTPRPFWHPAGVPPPPPMTSSFSTRPHVDPDDTAFSTYTTDLFTATSLTTQT